MFPAAAVEAGMSLFTTPNTRYIMDVALPQRRGIANGVRQTVQNAGYATSTALARAIVTSGLSSTFRQDVYAGTLSTLAPQALRTLTSGHRWAFLILAVICAPAPITSFNLPGPPGEECEPATLIGAPIAQSCYPRSLKMANCAIHGDRRRRVDDRRGDHCRAQCPNHPHLPGLFLRLRLLPSR